MRSQWYVAALILCGCILAGCGAPDERVGGDAGLRPVDPVDVRTLQAVLPDVPGWERTAPTGERLTSPFTFSQVAATYRRGDAEIEQRILDSGFNQALFTPFAALMAAGYTKETQNGFERSISVGGHPGWETWDTGTRNGELSLVVDRRFLVQIEGRSIDEVKTLHVVLDRTDLKALASLK